MSRKNPHHKGPVEIATQGEVLACDGDELKKNLWEVGVYLGTDDFVYYIAADRRRDGVKETILGKRPIGEYLRWVDGLFRPGEIPSEENGIHFRAARKLRELI
jgi:hypothetical protein